MSVGFFMGIGASYIDEAQSTAASLIRACSAALSEQRLPPYQDPRDTPNVYNGHKYGRSSLDHHSANWIVNVAGLDAVRPPELGHLGVIALNPYRVVFVPADLRAPILTDHAESIGGDNVRIWLGSSTGLLRSLLAVAPRLGIPIESAGLSDDIAQQIDDLKPMSDDEESSLAEDWRTAWLLLHEGARLSVEHRVALSLAG